MASCPKSFALISKHFLASVEDDDFADESNVFEGFDSIRDFLRQLATASIELSKNRPTSPGEADFSNLEQTLAQLAELSVKTETGDLMRIGSMLRTVFCLPSIPFFAGYIAESSAKNEAAQAAWQEMGATDWRTWTKAVMSEPVREQLADALYDLLISNVGDKPLMNFFVFPEKLGNFNSWDGGYSLEPERSKYRGTAHVGPNQIRWWISDDYSGEDGAVSGYEFRAVLLVGEQPSALVDGVAYIYDRVDGKPEASRAELLVTAGSVSDGDIQCVNSFLEQHGDADTLVAAGDLCFITTWQRRPGAEPGLGAQCLQIALQEIRSKFRNMSTAIFNIRPRQFLSWGAEVELPAVQVAKQSAIESLTGYISGISLADWTLRNIFTSTDWSLFTSMLAIGKQVLSESLGDIRKTVELHNQLGAKRVANGGIGRPTLVFDGHEEQLADLFHQTGLGHLALQIEEGLATYGEIEIALKLLIFGQRIFYAPVTLSSGFTPEQLRNEFEGVPTDIEPELDEFESSLPNDVTISRVFHYTDIPDFRDTVAQCVVEVQSVTPFGTLYEFYTLVPLPRPFNIVRWMNDEYMPWNDDEMDHPSSK